jgi:drug/metabolite transporter (DMT)-like permease
MLFLGLGVTFVGYSLVYYGLTQVQGGNWGYLDLVLPTRWTPDVAKILKDGASG